MKTAHAGGAGGAGLPGSWRETQQALLLDSMWALRERAKSRGCLGSALSCRGTPSPQVEETETSWVEEK